jgi:hypothetical protein
LSVHDDGDADIPVVDLSPAEQSRTRTRTRPRRARRVAAVALAAALVGATVAVVADFSSENHVAHRRVISGPRDDVRKAGDGQARLEVLSALGTTTAAGSFRLHSTLTESSGAGLTIVADSTVNVDPIAMIATANIEGGLITTRVNGTEVWESGGANYGLVDGATGPGAPLSQFAGTVIGTLGPREGAVAMSSLASPTGYLDIAEQEITAASFQGNGDVDGVAVRDYEVDVDAQRVLDRPGLTGEEIKTATAAIALLEQQGYRTTTIRLSVDPNGFVRRTQTTVHFADGGTVDADVMLSDYGCSTVSVGASGPEIVPNRVGCAASP